MRSLKAIVNVVSVASYLTAAIIASGSDEGTVRRGLGNSFFAFQDGLRGISFEEQAKLLKRLGYDGIEFEGTPEQVPEMLRVLDAQGLKMFSIYTNVCLTPEKGKPPYDPGLKIAIEHLKGRDTILWIPVWGGKPSAIDLDDRAVAILGEIADMADKSGLRIALYPHYAMYVERVADALRLVTKLDRRERGRHVQPVSFS